MVIIITRITNQLKLMDLVETYLLNFSLQIPLQVNFGFDREYDLKYTRILTTFSNPYSYQDCKFRFNVSYLVALKK